VLTASRRLRRLRPLAALAAALIVTALTGCSSGFDATSTKDYAPSDGVIAGTGDIRILNALVVAAEGADQGAISMTVVNRGETADRVSGIQSDAGEVTVDGDVSLPPGAAVSFGTEEATATISGLSKDPGQAVQVTVRFARAEPLTFRTVVVLGTDDYASLTPSASPTPTPTPTETPSESPSATASE
jgi:copper(I)-binding protein